MLSPVVIFVYNRPEHTIRTIEALAKNYLAKETTVYIFSDAAKDPKSITKVNKVRKYINDVNQYNYFKKIFIIEAQLNKGLAKSVIDGVTKVISEHGKIIVIEDDLITSKDFLDYMNNSLSFFKENQKIWSISGYNIPIKIPKSYDSDIYLSYRGSSWGWATWSDRWSEVDWLVEDYHIFKKNRLLRNKINRGGLDMANMLDAQMKGKIDSWAIRWCYSQSKLEKYTVYPVVSKVKNIGLDGSGTHSGISTKYDVVIGENMTNLENVQINKKIIKNFKKNYMSNFGYILIYPKKIIKSIFRIKNK